jgi:hypothetical protein
MTISFEPKIFNSQYSQYYFTQLQEMREVYYNSLSHSQKAICVDRLSEIKNNVPTIVMASFFADIFDRKDSILNFLKVILFLFLGRLFHLFKT